MIRPHARLSAAVLVAFTAATLTACSTPAEGPESATPTAAETPAASGNAPAVEDVDDEASGADAPEDPTAAPTCDTLIDEGIISDFESAGWTVKTQTFYLGDLEVTDGIQCIWADYESQASDQLQIFGWAPIEADAAADAQRALVAAGWLQEDSSEGIIITENPDTAFVRDDDGYGMTYLFTDGEVLLADTKQGLLLIDRQAS